jgi:hypothetical protein
LPLKSLYKVKNKQNKIENKKPISNNIINSKKNKIKCIKQNHGLELSYSFLSDIRSESKYPRVPWSPKPERSLAIITTEKLISSTIKST